MANQAIVAGVAGLPANLQLVLDDRDGLGRQLTDDERIRMSARLTGFQISVHPSEKYVRRVAKAVHERQFHGLASQISSPGDAVRLYLALVCAPDTAVVAGGVNPALFNDAQAANMKIHVFSVVNEFSQLLQPVIPGVSEAMLAAMQEPPSADKKALAEAFQIFLFGQIQGTVALATAAQYGDAVRDYFLADHILMYNNFLNNHKALKMMQKNMEASYEAKLQSKMSEFAKGSGPKNGGGGGGRGHGGGRGNGGGRSRSRGRGESPIRRKKQPCFDWLKGKCAGRNGSCPNGFVHECDRATYDSAVKYNKNLQGPGGALPFSDLKQGH